MHVHSKAPLILVAHIPPPELSVSQTALRWRVAKLGAVMLLVIFAVSSAIVMRAANGEKVLENANKLGPELKKILQHENLSKTAPPLTALAQIDAGGLEENRRSELSDLGVSLRSVAGDVLTMTVPASAITSLVALDWIIYVEASRPMSPEETDAPPPSAIEQF